MLASLHGPVLGVQQLAPQHGHPATVHGFLACLDAASRESIGHKAHRMPTDPASVPLPILHGVDVKVGAAGKLALCQPGERSGSFELATVPHDIDCILSNR